MELLAGIAEEYLESPAWHLCQLGGASRTLGRVYLDEALWQNLWEGRFREASRSPRRQWRSRTPSPSARLSYAQLHMLEMRFRGGQYSAKGRLDNPRQGVAVLDVRLHPGETSSTAFASLRDGAIMMYDLDPEHVQAVPSTGAPRASPLRELTPRSGGGPALCCLPVEAAGVDMLAAGYTSGRLGAWEISTGRSLVPKGWQDAHIGRVCALAARDECLLSASSDGLVKAWDLGSSRFGDARGSFPSHGAAVVSVATRPDAAQMFLTGSHDRTMRLWDARSGAAEVARWQQQDWVTCVEFHWTNNNQVWSSDKSVHRWDLRRPGAPPLASSHRHRRLISRFRADPLRLASCSLDGSVKVSSLEPPSVQRASPCTSPIASPVLGPTPAPNDLLGDQLLAGCDVCTLRASADYVLCIDFDATRLVAGGVDGLVEIYDFSDPGHFRWGSPSSSPAQAKSCRGEVVDFQLTGLPEVQV